MHPAAPTRFLLGRAAAALLFLAAAVVLPGDVPVRQGGVGIDLGPPGHNCRFWGMVGQGYPASLVEDQLRGAGSSTLRTLGGYNRDGWGFASFPSDTAFRRVLGGPVVRRGRPPASSSDPLFPVDPNFDVAVDEIQRLRPRALLGHVRTGSSGHWGLPDPHPFLHLSYAFAHNGGVPANVCEELTAAEDANYLNRYPPEYVRGTIDSEIYFLWLMCHREAHPELSTTEALREGLALLWPLVHGARINFVLTQGDTLYALRASAYDTGDQVRYYPNDDPTSPFWIAASQPMGTEGSKWAAIPATTLAVFVPGQAPSFYPIANPDPPVFSFRSIRVRGLDGDGDGKVSRFTVAAVPEVSWGSHDARMRVYRSGSGDPTLLAQSEDASVCAGRADTLIVSVEVAPPDLAAASWDLYVELAGPDSLPEPLVVATSASNPAWGLAGLAVEGSTRDAEEPPEPAVVPPPDRPWPNPSRGTFAIPVHAQKAATPVSLEIRDAAGALVFAAASLPASGNPPAVSWNGLDTQGRRVAAGTYFCRVRTGGETRNSKLTVLR